MTTTTVLVYKPEQYRVRIGNPESTKALCVGWKPLETLDDSVFDEYALVGNLYSPWGVNVILATLAMNPQITQLDVYRNDTLTKTDIGARGVDALVRVWTKREPDPSVLADEDIELAREVMYGTTIAFEQADAFDEFTTATIARQTERTMEMRSFHDFKIPEILTWPSNGLTFPIIAKDPFDGLRQLMFQIWKYGEITSIDREKEDVKELRNAIVTVNYDGEAMVIPGWFQREYPDVDTKSLWDYASKEFGPGHIKTDGKYRYSDIMRGYDVKDGVDQIEYIIASIRSTPESMDKEVMLWDAARHSQIGGSGRPCLTKLSFSVRGGVVDVVAFFRSHDILGAWMYNYFGVSALLHEVATRGGVKTGRVVIQSESAHVYQKDWTKLNDFAKTEFMESVVDKKFIAERDQDHQVVINIAVIDAKIGITVMSPDGGAILHQFTSKSARDGIMTLRHLDVIGTIDHALFVGSELEKAEMAIKLGVLYFYDKPLQLWGKTQGWDENREF